MKFKFDTMGFFLENYNFKSRNSFEFDVKKIFFFLVTSFILFNMLNLIITDWDVC
jgi:hypothetical protein